MRKSCIVNIYNNHINYTRETRDRGKDIERDQDTDDGKHKNRETYIIIYRWEIYA